MDGLLQSLAELDARRDQVIAAALETARELDATDRQGAAELLEIAEAVGRSEQAAHGQLLQLLAQADRIKAARGGVKAWVATHLDVTDGRARGIAQDARRIGAIPELAETLSSGKIGTGTVSVLSRTARAVANTDLDTTQALTASLEVAQSEGIAAAKNRVRELEHTLDPGSSQELITRQRARSFFRVVELEDGFCRFEVLLDAVRAAVLRNAVDQQSAEWIRRAQFDGERPVPEDVRSTEQINAQALVRIAEVFLTAPAEVRGASFSPSMLFFAPVSGGGGLAETVYGDLVPRDGLPGPGDAGTHLLECDEDGLPVRLDGVEIDTDPGARLASPRQRLALGWRDRHCTYPGCSRPATWSPHAHHVRPFSQGGATTMRNLAFLCSEHHSLTHQRQHERDWGRAQRQDFP